MGSEAPSWAEQWGAGGIGAMEDDGMRFQNKNNKNKRGKSKFTAKAKAMASVSVKKIKSTASSCVKWIKYQCNRKRASK